MPFAGYENFDACVLDQVNRGHSHESAQRICGALQSKIEKSKSSIEDEKLQSATDDVPDEDIEVLAEGPLFDLIQQYAENPEDKDIPEISEFYLTEDGNVVEQTELDRLQAVAMKGFSLDSISDKINESEKQMSRIREEVQKTAEGTTQSASELGNGTDMLSPTDIVPPPYPPELLAGFFEVDEVHYRCVRTKVTDSVCRPYELVPTVSIKTDNEENSDDADDSDDSRETIEKGAALNSQFIPDDQAISKKEITQEMQMIQDFIRDANDAIGFKGVMERAALDYESIGWAAIEVIRSADRKIRRIAHIPAVRVRVLKGWKGFVEIVDGESYSAASENTGRYVYYQNFGQKVVAEDPNKRGTYIPYDPAVHGDISEINTKWNLIDRKTGERTTSLSEAANEVLWIPRHHINTIYYGYSDIVPSLGWVLANVQIRDYLLQFFEHNAIPRYAIVVEGARLAKSVIEGITSYFSTHIKGKSHKTLIIPVPAMRGEVKLRFEKLGNDTDEGSFQETKKNNNQAIMTAHGVSPAIIGIAEHSELGSGKGLSQAEIYKDRIVTPSQQYWSEKLDRLFYLGLGVRYVSMRFSPLDIRDMEAEQRVLTGYLDKGAVTINQIRKLARLGPPIDGGDRAFFSLPSGIVFVDELTESMGSMMEESQIKLAEAEAALAQERSNRTMMEQSSDEPPSNNKKVPEDIED